MNCSHFGECGSCSNYQLPYEEALNKKKQTVAQLLQPFYTNEITQYESPRNAHRARAEFKIWHRGNECHYAMSNISKDGVTLLSECPKVIDSIAQLQYKLLTTINSNDLLKEKLFSIEFLGSKSGELLVTMIYHKKLNETWVEVAKELAKEYGIALIGRARKQKIVILQEYITERLQIKGKEYLYKYYEGGFTQPNPYVNEKMIEWAIDKVASNRGDFLELYCGLGNFTLPLSNYFQKVLATEISKNSIKAAKENCELNSVDNIEFIRLNASETAQALKGVRAFRRLEGISLDAYSFSTVLVDPPRAGLDDDSRALVKEFEHILYISCNPHTLARDLEELSKTHKVVDAAIFDQFPYTDHIESGVYLERL